MLDVRHADPSEPEALDQADDAVQPSANIGRQRFDLGRYRRIQSLDDPAVRHAENDIGRERAKRQGVVGKLPGD